MNNDDITPILIVGTGRCGSTMLSNMIRAHVDMLSISEFYSLATDYGGRMDEVFTEEPIDGAAFWAMIGEPQPRSSLALREGVAMPEIIYPFDAPGARFSAASGLPALLHATLPHLSDDPDALYDELRPFVLARPRAGVGEHHRALFAWLTRRMGKRAWLERSGGAFVMIPHVSRIFPDARWIHIVRDGRDTALSISRHVGFRLFILGAMFKQLTGIDPYYSDKREGYDQLPPALLSFLPERFDAEAFRNFQIPLEECGGLWSTQIKNGMEALSVLPRERVLHLRYEDFLASPESARVQLERLAAFVGEDFVDHAWAEAMAATVRAPTSNWRELPEAQRELLDAACRPGFEMLAAAGIEYSA